MMSELATALLKLDGEEIGADPGEILFHRGEPVSALFLVQEGGVHLVCYRADGTSSVLQRATGGSVLAEASIHMSRHRCDAIVLCPSTLRRIPKSLIQMKLHSDGAFAELWANHLAAEVQRMRIRAELFSIRTVAARLDAWLGFHEDRLPPKGEWRALAGEIGVAPEALYRELAKRRG